MKKEARNYAFIDGQNLYLGIQELGWKLDYKRFRIYLKEKYDIKKAYIFMGFLASNQELYNFLQTVGFVLIFKPILQDNQHPVKGNCDAELVLQAMVDFSDYDKALIVTGDGDFYCLVKHLDTNNKLLKVLAPSYQSCSSLLEKIAGKKISFASDLKQKLEYKRKEPHKDETS
ncbi:MAG: NYN domain-containing protein [Patescibacteria group bacterium]